MLPCASISRPALGVLPLTPRLFAQPHPDKRGPASPPIEPRSGYGSQLARHHPRRTGPGRWWRHHRQAGRCNRCQRSVVIASDRGATHSRGRRDPKAFPTLVSTVAVRRSQRHGLGHGGDRGSAGLGCDTYADGLRAFRSRSQKHHRSHRPCRRDEWRRTPQWQDVFLRPLTVPRSGRIMGSGGWLTVHATATPDLASALKNSCACKDSHTLWFLRRCRVFG